MALTVLQERMEEQLRLDHIYNQCNQDCTYCKKEKNR